MEKPHACEVIAFLSGPLHWVVPDFGGGCSDPGDSTDHDHLLRSEGGLPISIPANFGVGARGQERNESLAYPQLQQGKSPKLRILPMASQVMSEGGGVTGLIKTIPTKDHNQFTYMGLVLFSVECSAI